ncbi:MAG TPA: S-layer protein, partial [Nautiliaceae bacterium]|nr:S-layer protein [Nautiliaceae bacterium]
MKSFGMKVKENIKKISALGVSASLLGAQVAFAQSYTLNQGLKPFAEDIQNVKVVVGAQAKTIDVVAAIDLAAALSSMAQEGGKVVLEKEGGVLTSEGVVKLWRDNDKINIGEGLKVSALDKTDLPELLADGTFESDTGKDYDYRQYIDLNTDKSDVKFLFGKPESDEDPRLHVDFSGTDKSDPLFTYRLEFEEEVPFIENGKANEDLIGNKIEILGKNYVFSQESEPGKLVFYEASKKVVVKKGETTSVTIADKDYEISIEGFGQEEGSDKIVINVNGDIDSVKEGNTKTIGGLTIYVDSVWTEEDNKEGGAVLLVGGKKLILEDGKKVKLGDDEDPVKGTEVEIDWTDSDKTKAREIKIKFFKPDSDNDYVDKEKSFVDPVFKQIELYYDGANSELKGEDRIRMLIDVQGDDRLEVNIPYGGS